jgi:hypothetical protein
MPGCVAGSVMLVVSLSWVALYSFTPTSSRPYVDGSTNNSAVAMVFGYNGLERFGIPVPGAVSSGPGLTVRTPAGPAGSPVASRAASAAGRPRVTSGGFTGNSGGWAKLIDSRFGPEIGWLFPLALLALAAGLLSRRGTGGADRLRGGFVMWGGWLLTFGLVYSVMSVLPHTAYVAALAAPAAALSAAGIVMCWRWYTAGDKRGWLLPLAIAAELAWAASLWSGYRGFLPWVLPAAGVAGLAAIVVLVAVRLSGRALTRLATAGLAAGVLAMLAAPAAWAGSVLDAKYAGSSFDASAGPAGGFGAGTGPGGPGAGGTPGARPGRFAPGGTGAGGAGRVPFPGGGTPGRLPAGARGGPAGGRPGGGILSAAATTLTSTERQIFGYVSAHRAGAGYLLAVQSWAEASPYILATGQEVLPLGGFSGSVPEPTLRRAEQLVHGGQLRFFLLGGRSGPGQAPGADASGSQAQRIARWVSASCAKVPAKDYAGTAAGTTAGAGTAGTGRYGTALAGTLYACGRNA